MQYKDLREFVEHLERGGLLKRIATTVDPRLEMTEICDRVLRRGGPALLFEQPKGFRIPVLANLFGTPERVALAMGRDNVDGLREIGQLLAFLKEPEPPKGLRGEFSDQLKKWGSICSLAASRFRSSYWAWVTPR